MNTITLDQIIAQLQGELTSLKSELHQLKTHLYSPIQRISLAEAEQQLGISDRHIHQLMGIGLLTSGQRMGHGRKAHWTFDANEIGQLAKNRALLTPKPPL